MPKITRFPPFGKRFFRLARKLIGSCHFQHFWRMVTALAGMQGRRSLKRIEDLTDKQRTRQAICVGHTHEQTHPDVTIQTCWDSDRLDLGRVGITPHPSRLCTDVAKKRETIRWADGRACFAVTPDFVADEWGIVLPGG